MPVIDVEQHCFAVAEPPDELRTIGATQCCTVVFFTDNKAVMAHFDSATDITYSLAFIQSQFDEEPAIRIYPGVQDRGLAEEIETIATECALGDPITTCEQAREVSLSFGDDGAPHIQTTTEGRISTRDNPIRGPFLQRISTRDLRFNATYQLFQELSNRLGCEPERTPLFPITPIAQKRDLCRVPIDTNELPFALYMAKLEGVLKDFAQNDLGREIEEDQPHVFSPTSGGYSRPPIFQSKM